MAIKTDFTEGKTLCTCDRCGALDVSSSADGRAPDGWGTGQLWIDVSLSEQAHVSLCFCEECFPAVVGSGVITIQVAPVED